MGKQKRHRYRYTARRVRFFPSVRPARAPFWTILAVTASVVVLFGAIAFVVARRQRVGAALEAAVMVPGGDVQLDVAHFRDGKARFYRHSTAAGKEIRFFVLKDSSGVIRVAMDTCKECYRVHRGYRQVGDSMVCNACGKAFRSVDVGILHGQCNPVPIDHAIQGDQVIVTAVALDAEASHF